MLEVGDEKGQKGIKIEGPKKVRKKFHSEAETATAGPKSTTEPALTSKATPECQFEVAKLGELHGTNTN